MCLLGCPGSLTNGCVRCVSPALHAEALLQRHASISLGRFEESALPLSDHLPCKGSPAGQLLRASESTA